MQLKGNFIFAKIAEVQSHAFWAAEQNIGLIVSCLRDPRGAKYPSSATSQIEVKHFERRSAARFSKFGHPFKTIVSCSILAPNEGLQFLFPSSGSP